MAGKDPGPLLGALKPDPGVYVNPTPSEVALTCMDIGFPLFVVKGALCTA